MTIIPFNYFIIFYLAFLFISLSQIKERCKFCCQMSGSSERSIAQLLTLTQEEKSRLELDAVYGFLSLDELDEHIDQKYMIDADTFKAAPKKLGGKSITALKYFLGILNVRNKLCYNVFIYCSEINESISGSSIELRGG